MNSNNDALRSFQSEAGGCLGLSYLGRTDMNGREKNPAPTLVNSPADSKTRYALDGKSSKPHLDM
jgi:hypothetical protein